MYIPCITEMIMMMMMMMIIMSPQVITFSTNINNFGSFLLHIKVVKTASITKQSTVFYHRVSKQYSYINHGLINSL